MEAKHRRWPRQVRMTDDEYRRACGDAAAAGLAFGKYVRKLLSDHHGTQDRRALARFVERMQAEQARIKHLVPDVSDHDLSSILSCMMRPISERRFFLRRHKDGYAF